MRLTASAAAPVAAPEARAQAPASSSSSSDPATASAAKRRPPAGERSIDVTSGAISPGGGEVDATAAFGRPSSFRVRQLSRSAIWRATREAIAMMVIIGLTPMELGSRLPSAM